MMDKTNAECITISIVGLLITIIAVVFTILILVYLIQHFISTASMIASGIIIYMNINSPIIIIIFGSFIIGIIANMINDIKRNVRAYEYHEEERKWNKLGITHSKYYHN